MNNQQSKTEQTGTAETSSSQARLEQELEEVEESLEHLQLSGRRLPIFLFVATFLGSLLGLAADFNEATGLVEPFLEFLNPAPELRISGSNTVLGEGIEMASEWQQEFEAQKVWNVNIPLIGTVSRTVNVTVDGVGTTEGCRRAVQGQVDLLVASEPIPCYDQLVAQGIEVKCMAEIGYDVVTFVTDINNDVKEVEKREMISMLNGSLTNWSEVGAAESEPIRVLARKGSGTTDLILRKFTDFTIADWPSHFRECNSNDACLDLALTMPGSLYWVSAAWLQTQPPRYLKLILIPRERGKAAQDPRQADFDPDKYPAELMRPLYMYVFGGNQFDPESTGLAQEFLHYVRGVRGQEILEKHHFYTHFDPPADTEVELLPGFEPGPDGLPTICQQ